MNMQRKQLNKRIMVTGGAGFFGSAIVNRLIRHGYTNVTVPDKGQYDLKDQEAVQRAFDDAQPDIVVHAAGRVGGIAANHKYPGSFFYENALMGLQVLELARQKRIEKVVVIGTVCSYPKNTPVPFREQALWDGYPDPSNAPYGMAKRMLLVQAQAYRAQYGLNAVFVIPTNLYGPNDNFDPTSSHVIPALIHKMSQAQSLQQSSVTIWGTGRATRDFLYVEDAAEAIIRVTERYNDSQPLNLGSGKEVPIRELAALIARSVKYKGQIEWDAAQPEGQPRRLLATTRAAEVLGWQATTPLETGLKKTIAWYKLHKLAKTTT